VRAGAGQPAYAEIAGAATAALHLTGRRHLSCIFSGEYGAWPSISHPNLNVMCC
jgi:hypothetical protein